MRPVAAVLAVLLGGAAGASAQTAAPQPWYVAGVAGGTVGSTSGGLFGGEAGRRFAARFEVFVDAGWATNVTPKFLKDKVKIVDAYLSSVQSGGVGSTVEEPASYMTVGLRYYLGLGDGDRFRPYVLGGVGAANVQPDVTFKIDGSDVTDSLGDYGVQLGKDLTSHVTKTLATAGGGMMLPRGRMQYDVGYRYVAIFTKDKVTNVSRLYGAVGYRF